MANHSPQVTIVILNYNGAADTIACIASLLNITYSNYSLVIVDNASTDGSISMLTKYLNSIDNQVNYLNTSNGMLVEALDRVSAFFDVY